jgi:hypothetical protein
MRSIRPAVPPWAAGVTVYVTGPVPSEPVGQAAGLSMPMCPHTGQAGRLSHLSTRAVRARHTISNPLRSGSAGKAGVGRAWYQ